MMTRPKSPAHPNQNFRLLRYIPGNGGHVKLSFGGKKVCHPVSAHS